MTDAEHTPYSKRVMELLGYRRFAVAGHDRGSYIVCRTALDHPDRVSKLVVMDSVTVEALERCDAEFAAAWCTGGSWRCWRRAQTDIAFDLALRVIDLDV